MATILDQLVVDIVFRGDRKELDKFEQGVKNLNQQLNKVARGFAVAGAALTAALVGVAKISLTHEQAVNNLRVLNKLTEEQIALLEKQAQEEGGEGRFDSKDVLAAQHELIRVGWDHNQVLKEMTHIIAFATAGELDLAIAAQQVVGQLGQMDLEASGTEQAVNFMGKAFQNSNVALGNFSRLTQNVNENARQAGFSIEEITAASLHLGKEAGGASRAFQTAFADMEMVLKELLDLTPEGASILDGLDIDPKDVGAIGLPEFLRRVATLTNDELQEVFGTEYWSKVRELVGASDIEAIGELHRNLTTDMEGTIQAMADVKNSGAPGAWEDLKSAINALNVSLGKAGILFLLEHAFNALRKFIDAITHAPGPVRTVIAVIIGMGPALLAVGAGLKLITFGLSGLVPLLKAAAWANTKFGISAKFAAFWNSNFILSLRLAAINVRAYVASQILATLWNSNFVVSLRLAAINVRGFVASLSLARVAQLAGAAATGIASAATWVFNAALLANPLTWIVLAIVGLIAALVLLVKHWDTVTDALKFAWNWIKGNWPLLASILLGPFGIVGALVWKFRDKIIGAFVSIKDFFMGIWGTIVGIFRDHWAKILAVIFPGVGLPILIAQEWDQIVGFVGDIWSRVYNNVKGWIEAIISFIKELPGKVKDAVKDIPNMVKDAVKDIPVVGQVLDVAGGVADKAKGFLGGIGKVFTGAAGGVVPGPLGRAVPSIIHGGEMVLPPGASNVLAQMLEGFRLGPAALPQAPPHYGQMYRSSVTNRTVNINITEPIVIHTQATDAKGIAQEIGEMIQDQIRNIAYDHDGPVER